MSKFFYVPWSKKTGFLPCYCNYTKKLVILDLEAHYTDIGQTWESLRRKGMKIKKVQFKEVK